MMPIGWLELMVCMFDNILPTHVHLEAVRNRRINTRIIVVTTAAANSRALSTALRCLAPSRMNRILGQALLRVINLVVRLR